MLDYRGYRIHIIHGPNLDPDNAMLYSRLLTSRQIDRSAPLRKGSRASGCGCHDGMRIKRESRYATVRHGTSSSLWDVPAVSLISSSHYRIGTNPMCIPFSVIGL